MGRSARNPQGNHGGKGTGKRTVRGGDVPPWDRENTEQDPCGDLRDLYDDEPREPENDDYAWPSDDKDDDD